MGWLEGGGGALGLVCSVHVRLVPVLHAAGSDRRDSIHSVGEIAL